MTLHFKSTYGKDKNVIEFKSNLEKTFEDDLNVLIFEENREGKKIKNRIEFNEQIVNIYSGVSTIQLELNEKIKNLFKTEVTDIYIWTFLEEINIKENGVDIKYKISAGEDLKDANQFLLELKWK